MNAKSLLLAAAAVAGSFAPPLDVAAAPDGDLRAVCARVGDDDTIRAYSPALRADTVRAFRALFPGATRVPDDEQLKAQANFRCMNGRALVCFIGANLPCGKMNAARDNAGASEYCRSNPNADDVPAFATGHDAVYSYRCRDGRAEIDRRTWELDARGFAKKLWSELPGG
jgi:hypothetical protein